MRVLEEGLSSSITNSNDTPISLQSYLKRKGKNGAYKPSRAMTIGLRFLDSIRMGYLNVVMPDGTTLQFGGAQDGPNATLHVHHDRLARRFMMKGQLGFCEAYLDGDWSSPDITAFFVLIQENQRYMRQQLLGKKWVRMLLKCARLLQSNSKRGSKKNIYAHYDIGNDFYGAWLDESMTYSSGLWLTGDEDLKTAQDQKYQGMIDRADIHPGDHVLEIGCGWGGFAEYAARNLGCKVTGVTISQEQYEYAKDRIEAAGLSHLVDIRLQDYRDIEGQFDRIVSIEMFEAVGEEYWPVFFAALKDRLKKSGKACLQIITIRDEDFADYRSTSDYIQRYIFPGGMLPSKSVLIAQIENAGLDHGEMYGFGADYARTLALWNEAFQAAWPDLQSARMDDRFKRMWEQYLSYCEAGFTTDSIDVIQIPVFKP